MTAARNGLVSHVRTLFTILKKNMETALDCDRIWDDYFASVATNFLHPDATSRFQRLNPRLEGDVPGLDEKGRLDHVRKLASAALLRDTAITCAAHRLLASLFYFHLSSVSDGQKGSYHVQGECNS